MDILESVLNQPMFFSLSITLLHSIWQGTIIAFGLYLFLRFTNKKQSEIRYAVCLMAMALNLIIPLLTFFTIYQPQSPIVAINTITSSLAELHFISADNLTNSQFDWYGLTPLISLIWMLGVVYLSIHLLIEMIRVYQLPRYSVVQTSDKLQKMFDHIARQLGINKAARLAISMKADVPMVIGWLRPVVLLPLSMSSGLTTAQLEMLITHELAHIKRHDYLVNFIQTLVEIILFFHPCVKWISKQVRAEREYCCDDIAVNQCGNALAYATALTDAEMLRPHNIPQLAMAASGGNLKKRILRVVEQQSCSPRYTGQWFASLFSFALVVSIFTAGQVTAISNVDDKTTEQESVNDLLSNIEPVTIKPKKIQTHPMQVKTKAENTLLLDKQIVAEIKATERVSVAKLEAKKIFVKNNQEKVTQKPVLVNKNKAALPLIEPTTESQMTVLETKSVVKKESVTTALTRPVQPSTNENTRIAPKLIKNVIPSYPRSAINNKMVGEIDVSFIVSTDGRVEQLKFDGIVHHSFRRSIKKALRKWRFEPGRINGKKTEIPMTKRFNFTEPPDLLITTTGSRIVSS